MLRPLSLRYEAIGAKHILGWMNVLVYIFLFTCDDVNTMAAFMVGRIYNHIVPKAMGTNNVLVMVWPNRELMSDPGDLFFFFH